MDLTGYSDRWSVRPGNTIGFHIHSTAAQYEAQVVRLRHGDENPRGPGFKEIVVPSPADGRYPGAPRSIRPGSYGIADLSAAMDGESLWITTWIWPTVPGRGRQGVLSGRSAIGTTVWSLSLSETGALEWQVGGTTVMASGHPLDAREWYFVAAGIEKVTHQARLLVWRQRFTTTTPQTFDGAASLAMPARADSAKTASVLFGTARIDETMDGPAPRHVFNGKIAAPRLFSQVLDQTEVLAVRKGAMPKGLVAAWDFSRAPESTRLIDVGPRKCHGETRNRPARLMTGPSWSGDIRAIEAYDAVHFHDDDVADVGWPESLRLTIPADWKSGVYALRLRAEGTEDHLPFFVCPPRGTATNAIAFLVPTLSYLVYSNESLDIRPTVQLAPLQDMEMRPEAYRYIAEHGLMSAYDKHSDGSGICHASLRRPILDFRPKARCRTFNAPHQFPADLYLVDWLEEKGFHVRCRH
jgi:N,N-dimethylformamidase